MLVHEVNNGGARLVYGYFNEGGPGYETANVGTGFLMRNGHAVAAHRYLLAEDGARL